jgi:VWFA-related protein
MFKDFHFRSAVLAVFALTGLACAQESGDSSALAEYRSTVSEVRVTFSASKPNNLGLQTLTPSDFAVVDGDLVVRNFRSFEHSGETSLDVVVLIDMSESVAPRFRTVIGDLLQRLERQQSTTNERFAVLSFGGTPGGTPEVHGSSRMTTETLRPAVLCATGCGAAEASAKIQTIRSGGLTPLFDALMFSADFISHQRQTGERDRVRTVLLLFTDGNDTISMHSASDALRAIQDTGALVYTVDLGSSGALTRGGLFLQRASASTGGRYFASRSFLDDPGSLLRSVVEDQSASYVVTYRLPSPDAGFHAVRILPTRDLGLTFHCRSGYFYEPRD